MTAPSAEPGMVTVPAEVAEFLAAARRSSGSGPPSWHQDAACAEVGGDWWFPERGGSIRQAKAICAGCPVRETCSEDAIARGEQWGVWGGRGEGERRRIISRNRRGRSA